MHSVENLAVQDELPVRLTPREIEVLTLLVEGEPSKKIANKLFVSKRTVDFHLVNIYEKLQVNSRIQAFRRATQLGIVSYNFV